MRDKIISSFNWQWILHIKDVIPYKALLLTDVLRWLSCQQSEMIKVALIPGIRNDLNVSLLDHFYVLVHLCQNKYFWILNLESWNIWLLRNLLSFLLCDYNLYYNGFPSETVNYYNYHNYVCTEYLLELSHLTQSYHYWATYIFNIQQYFIMILRTYPNSQCFVNPQSRQKCNKIKTFTHIAVDFYFLFFLRKNSLCTSQSS